METELTKYQKYYRRNRARRRTQAAAWRASHREEIADFNRKYKRLHREELRAKLNALRLRALTMYSDGEPACANPHCREHRVDVLGFDHVNGNGAWERRNGYKGYTWIRRLLKKRRKDIQVLCLNCNWIKYLYGKDFDEWPRRRA